MGHGQQELTTSCADAMRAADNQVIFRETVRGIGAKHGLFTSFAPKPFPDQPGNGAHIHFSLWDARFITNRLYDGEALYGLTPLARNFIGGVLAHLPALLALSCPSYNSYRRLHQPRSWTSAYTAWGPDNREAAVRVASGLWSADAKSVNLELKPVDPSCNPYLALAGLIAAGIDGVERELDPGEPVQMDPAVYSNEELAARGIKRLPTNQMEAMLALRADSVIMTALGPELANAYLAVRTSEYAAFRRETTGFEIQHHLLKF
jgi:glutamine synthetase